MKKNQKKYKTAAAMAVLMSVAVAAGPAISTVQAQEADTTLIEPQSQSIAPKTKGEAGDTTVDTPSLETPPLASDNAANVSDNAAEDDANAPLSSKLAANIALNANSNDLPSTLDNGDIAINTTNFPDTNFRNWILKQTYGADGKLTPDEIANITSMDVSKQSITNLTGIQYFTALTSLDCSGNGFLQTLDLSQNKALINLNCSMVNRLTTLNLSQNTELKTLNCSQMSYLTPNSLDLTHNTKLTDLNCSNNSSSITSLNLSQNTALKTLDCSHNYISTLDLSPNTALTSLTCISSSGHALTSLDVSKNIALTSLDCSDGRLTSLDLSKNTALETLDCSGNYNLHSIDLSQNTKLKSLKCASNKFNALDLSKNTALETLHCGSSGITTLDLTNNTALTDLDLYYNNALTSVDLSKNAALTTLSIQQSDVLTKLDASNLAALKTVTVSYNPQLVTLDVSGCAQLESLVYSSNNNLTTLLASNCASLKTIQSERGYPNPNLTTVDASNCTSLITLDGNKATVNVSNDAALEALTCGGELDVSSCAALKTLSCSGSKLTSLDLSNNPNLTSLSLGYTSLKTLDLSQSSKNPNLETININNNDLITSLDVSNLPALKALNLASNAQLSTVDASNCKALTTLATSNYSGSNHITKLNVTNDTALESLNCKNEYLTDLDLSTNTALKTLDCSGNQLNELDLSKNTALERVNCDGNPLLCLNLPDSSTNINVSTSHMVQKTIFTTDGTFDLTTIAPHIVVNKITNLINATRNGNSLMGLQAGTQVTYNYSLGSHYPLSVTLMVKQANSWTTPLTMGDWKLGDTPKDPVAAAKYGTPTFTYSDKEDGTFASAKPTTIGTWYVKATVAEGSNYGPLESTVPFQITGEAPPPITEPTGLTATYGQTLNDVSLPTGWTWVAADTPVTVKNNGYEAKLTVTDDGKYDYSGVPGYDKDTHTVTRTLPVTVAKATPPTITEPEITQAAGVVYGQTLGDIELPAGWVWVDDPTTKVTVNNHGYKARLAVDDDNYDYTGVDGYVGEALNTFLLRNANFLTLTALPTSHYVERTIHVTVKKATPPDITVPTGLQGTVGKTLAEIAAQEQQAMLLNARAALPDGWTWADPTQVIQEGSHQYAARLAVDDDNYDYTGVQGYNQAGHYVERMITVEGTPDSSGGGSGGGNQPGGGGSGGGNQPGGGGSGGGNQPGGGGTGGGQTGGGGTGGGQTGSGGTGGGNQPGGGGSGEDQTGGGTGGGQTGGGGTGGGQTGSGGTGGGNQPGGGGSGGDQPGGGTGGGTGGANGNGSQNANQLDGNNGDKNVKTGDITASVAGGLSLAAIISACTAWFALRKKKKAN